ncbi:MAG: helix-turn-helix domain-containing protein [Actinomycetota bacterium]|nr:helix-turn-helix domain-containing protein [Actinomycetota bacterium]
MERDLASVLVEARQAAGLTQAELARRAGISPSYLSRIEGAAWERGGPWPSDSVLRALARVLGLSSTELVAMHREARSRSTESRPQGHPTSKSRRSPYAVSVGHDEVDRAAREVIGRNRRGGTLRSVHVGRSGEEPSYVDALLSAATADPGTMLYRVSASADPDAGPSGPVGGNVRIRFTSPNPLALDVLVGEQEVLLAVPAWAGRPYLRAAIVVDDPDFVAAVREWFDDSIWDAHDQPPPGHDMARGAGGGHRRAPRARPPDRRGAKPDYRPRL